MKLIFVPLAKTYCSSGFQTHKDGTLPPTTLFIIIMWRPFSHRYTLSKWYTICGYSLTLFSYIVRSQLSKPIFCFCIVNITNRCYFKLYLKASV